MGRLDSNRRQLIDTKEDETVMTDRRGLLEGLRVVELADETAEYCGLLLASLGAYVVKVEPPGGSPSRRIGPFYGGESDPERSVFFWNYNRAKRSIVLDLTHDDDAATLRELVADADILLDATQRGSLERIGLGPDALDGALIWARITPFGDDGPWADFRGSDLVHLALGGVMMNCGYDPDPNGRYDLPPIAPQLWHAYHIAGDQLLVGILAALTVRERTGRGQKVSVAIHEAVAQNTELDVTSWVLRRQPLGRQTCQHAGDVIFRVPTIAATKDGRWFMVRWSDDAVLTEFLGRYGMAADLAEHQPEVEDAGAKLGRPIPGASTDGSMSEFRAHQQDVVQRFVRAFTYDTFPWREAQKEGLMFAPLRKPHENASDPHWLARRSFTEIEHPELGKHFTYVTSKWLSTANEWVPGRRAPLRDEDRAAVVASIRPRPSRDVRPLPQPENGHTFALEGVRILDFSWFLATAGGTRFLTSLGAETIKVEWRANPDTRFGVQAPVGGRSARERADAPLPGIMDPMLGGQFNNKNPGKRGLSLNVRDPRGLAIARRLVSISDVVAEGFSPGVLDRWGLGYDELRSLRSDIIYAQQSAAGQYGTYGRLRTIGPVAQSMSGQSEMSGLPEPAMPAGWGYSYLDWVGAYNFSAAILGALYHRERTGEGQWIDASQIESGLFLTGTSVLDWSANGSLWSRIGNRSPYKPAAPHGAYRCAGVDRWIAIACFADADWQTLAEVVGQPGSAQDPRFATLADRLANQDELDALVSSWTTRADPFDLMMRLQARGVAAGVCQTAEDRVDHDPQLAGLDWLTEVSGTKIGRWPVTGLPFQLSATPSHVGGRIDRGAPGYGEDNEFVLGELLGLSTTAIRELEDADVV